ncbi:MFHA1 protein, partial [Amia calva]|nr:MFHA1 protein [Amia calva]
KIADWSKRKLKVLPQEVLEDINIFSLNLERNRFKDVSGISKLINLKELTLSRNEFVEFPSEIQFLVNLEKLYLNQNKIQSIPEEIFPKLQKLELLKLSTNRLSKLPTDLRCCKNLLHLGLSHNYLKELTEAVVGLPSLRELYVDNNRLSELPAELFNNKSLVTFRAASNRLREPPDEVCIGGLKQIRSYFKQLKLSQPDFVRRVKTMFLGSSMAGKSTLCRSLKDRQPVMVDVKDRTVGIEISEVQIEGFRFLFWDFAGQEEYYLTHHVFITPQALVILVIDLASYNIDDPQSFKEKVSFWINNVMMRVPDSVILPVGTHIDKCRDDREVQEKKCDIGDKIKDMLAKRELMLDQRRKNIDDKIEPKLFSDQSNKLDQVASYSLKCLDLVPIDCTNYKDIEQLQEKILDFVQDIETFPNVVKKLPHIYQAVESAIEDLIKDNQFPKHGIVSLTQLLTDIKQKVGKLDEDDLKGILRYLHYIGIIVWYEEIPALSETVFVKPSFLITLFKIIVRLDLKEQLECIPRELLLTENSLVKDRNMWAEDFHSKATLHSTAMRLLVKMTLQKGNISEDEDFVEEIAGTRHEKSKLLSLLEHFEICLPATPTKALNPQAREFVPHQQWRKSGTEAPTKACLFPSLLKHNSTVSRMWGEDKLTDVRVRIYFLPEIPHGFFHRLIIKACSLYAPYWVGQEQCLVMCNAKPLLFKQNCEEDQFIEIRYRRPEDNKFQQMWDMIQAIIQKIKTLMEQWPGLCQHICSPCTVPNCSADYEWTDLSGSDDIYDMVKDDKLTCRNGHTERTELLFPKGIVPVLSQMNLHVNTFLQ